MIIREYRETTQRAENLQHNLQTATMVNRLLAGFDRFHLNENSIRAIKSFLNYLSERDKLKAAIPYNFIIHCNDTDRALPFADALLSAYQSITKIKAGITTVTEERFLEKPQTVLEAMNKTGFIVICQCLSQREYAPGDGSSRTDDMICKRNNTWKDFLVRSENTPQSHKIIIAPEYILRERFRNNEHLYFRICRNHVYIDDMTSDEVYKLTVSMLKAAQFGITAAFSDALQEYIRVVYPRADLKNRQFANDLVERICTLVYSESVVSKELTAQHIPFYRKEKKYDEILREMDGLVGLNAVKKALGEISYVLRDSPRGSAPSLHMAFVGNPGTGKTTVANLAANLLYSMGAIQKNKVITVSALDLVAHYIGHTSDLTKSYCRKAYGGILFIDEAYLLASRPGSGRANDDFRQEAVGALIQEMENNRDCLLVIFAGYTKEMDDFLHKSNPGLGSRLYKTIEFEDYSDDELTEIFIRMCKDEKYTITPEAEEKVRLKLSAMRYDPEFGNARTVRLVFQDAKKECRLSDPCARTIKPEHIILETKLRDYASVKKELDAMIGLDSAKEEIRRMIETCRFSKETGISIPFSKHMLFVGNAGTGKSTVAKLFCEMMFSIGASKSPNCVAIAANDLFGAADGGPAEKLREYCRKASGGVLFIDEAYILQDYPKVITALLTVMEEERDNIIIILAGYRTEMDGFLKENQGLKSRFSVTVQFDDYSDDQLADIFLQYCSRYRFTVSSDGLEQLRKVIALKKQEKNFGNARAMRNIFEQAFRQHAINYRADPDHCGRMELGCEDIVIQTAPDKRMGF